MANAREFIKEGDVLFYMIDGFPVMARCKNDSLVFTAKEIENIPLEQVELSKLHQLIGNAFAEGDYSPSRRFNR